MSRDSDEDTRSDQEPLLVLGILNRFCLKIREEAIISSKAQKRIRSVTISVLKATSWQSKEQVIRILQDNGVNSSSMPELQDAFLPSLWEHGSCDLSDRGDYGNTFPNISPREIKLGLRRQWKRLKNGESRIADYPERFFS